MRARTEGAVIAAISPLIPLDEARELVELAEGAVIAAIHAVMEIEARFERALAIVDRRAWAIDEPWIAAGRPEGSVAEKSRQFSRRARALCALRDERVRQAKCQVRRAQGARVAAYGALMRAEAEVYYADVDPGRRPPKGEAS